MTIVEEPVAVAPPPPFRFPETLEELARAGLCQHCLEAEHTKSAAEIKAFERPETEVKP